MTAAEQCEWCGETVGADDGFRATEPAGERVAAFCRLEHIVPWVISGAHWEPGTTPEPGSANGTQLTRCAHCGASTPDARVLLVRHRGEHRIADAFCGTAHLMEWAKRGGRWA